ncbi:LysE family translocator [Campylobacter blaseri]|uniref:Lysine transporter LysE n=1 Tax=Campylobacter blaseri TaxID=2042961 RepID=A0A2P8R0I1_9BACT|nr:LysE family transporter [Campylobacter blaseri]PSM51999.1 hypothetical protein CQ405_05395 [Campylobacter blaseri]PSM53784.1 hypothetical protein CRN67_05395 [Campylobacter blaseri]
MQEFLQGIMIGLSVALPFGPLNILVMSYAIHSYKHALITGIGAVGADVIYYFLISIGVLQVLNSPEFFNILSVVGSLVLVYLAYDMYKNASKDIALETNLQKNNFKIF